ncbi:hypothetical protein Tco_1134716 [Tanacetum coccineum]
MILEFCHGGNLLERSYSDVLSIIENKSKVRNSQNKSVVSQVKSSDGNSSSSNLAKLTHAVNQQMSVVTTAMTAILKQFQATPPPAFVKAIEEICVTYGGVHPYYQCLAAGWNTFLNIGIIIQDTLSCRRKMLKSLLSNKEKLIELANTPLNENCSAEYPYERRYPESLGPWEIISFPCGFNEDSSSRLADLGAQHKLDALSVWKG